ncbi:gamma-interferon-responsive lysosomal thiol protein isoform X1 [Coffea eugenioides]|uniref:gamma-interferon-responsive lysosomal thiol protein isoform X1 n=1 Tax=Coffea eugenioides TaxID=49369 RepID=UPI000F61097E|nr:gamma-interferon-responsive lysosomal thiol protein isoform X1 [Coffea eugenioides]
MNFKLQSHMIPTFHMTKIYFLLFLLFLTFVSPISCKKVSLGLSYESNCPYSVLFVVEDLYKIFYNGLIDIVDLHLVPWGNARILDNNTIQCQHGPYECLLNTIEACAIDVWPDVHAHFPFIYCVEKLIYDGKKTEWETCFLKLGLDEKPVTDCYESGRGKELNLRNAAVTGDLRPPHTYVPWVTVDGQPLYDDYIDFVSFICKAYKGSPVPAACSGLSAADVSEKGSLNIFTPVCYTGVTIKSLFSGITTAVASWVRGVTEAAAWE